MLVAILLVACSAVMASAASERYQFQTDTMGSGADWWLDTGKKEYKDLSISCTQKKAQATLALWKKWIFGDVHYEADQTKTVGTGRYCWWNGDKQNNAEYHITARVTGNSSDYVSFSGIFETSH